jgi:DNA repair protein endonuclease SAE2/CtIP C-terminus
MNSEILAQEGLDSIRDRFLEAFELAYTELAAELQRARDEVDTLRNHITTLEQDKSTLQRDLNDQKAGYAKLYDAHDQLKQRARRMKKFIVDSKVLPEGVRGDSTNEPLLSDNSSTSKDEISTTESKGETCAQRLSNAPSTGLNDGAGSSTADASQPTNPEAPEPLVSIPLEIESAHVGSDPASESTETASAPATQSARKPLRYADVDSDSDVPQVVFERSLKRKRSARNQVYIKPEPVSPQRSSPDPATLDLDEVTRPLTAEDSIQALQVSRPTEEKHRCASEGDVQVHVRQQTEQNIECVSSSPRRHRRNQSATESKIYEDPDEGNIESIRLIPHSYASIRRSLELPDSRSIRVLQPKTSNPRTPSTLNNLTSALLPKSSRRQQRWLEIYGEDQASRDDENLLDPGPSPTLQDLLNSGDQPHGPLLTPHPRQSARNHNTARSTRSMRRLQKFVTPIAAAKRPVAATEPRTTLRMCSPQELRLEDFRHNPARNDGVDFAFSEVVRKKDQRKCLPGCTKPECCGDKFNRVVQIGGFTTPSRPTLGDAMRGEPYQAVSDEQLLRNFLGDSAGRLEYMSSAEREDLLQRAKALAFAETHGKHRNQHARPTTPPGFWRTDMPSTQEAKKDEEAAKALQQHMVEERRREAMQRDGRWVFRDEYPRSV